MNKIEARNITPPNPHVGQTGEVETTLEEIKTYLVINSLLLEAILKELETLQP